MYPNYTFVDIFIIVTYYRIFNQGPHIGFSCHDSLDSRTIPHFSFLSFTELTFLRVQPVLQNVLQCGFVQLYSHNYVHLFGRNIL